LIHSRACAPASAGQRLAVSSLGLTLMSEAVRTDGVAEYLATGAEREALIAAGVAFEVLREDVQASVDAERARLANRAIWGVDPQPRGSDVFFEEFRDYAELNAFFDDLVTGNPGVITRETIGQSVQGRDIEAFTIMMTNQTSDDAKP
jgi:hypothetical protein